MTTRLIETNSEDHLSIWKNIRKLSAFQISMCGLVLFLFISIMTVLTYMFVSSPEITFQPDNLNLPNDVTMKEQVFYCGYDTFNIYDHNLNWIGDFHQIDDMILLTAVNGGVNLTIEYVYPDRIFRIFPLGLPGSDDIIYTVEDVSIGDHYGYYLTKHSDNSHYYVAPVSTNEVFEIKNEAQSTLAQFSLLSNWFSKTLDQNFDSRLGPILAYYTQLRQHKITPK